MSGPLSFQSPSAFIFQSLHNNGSTFCLVRFSRAGTVWSRCRSTHAAIFICKHTSNTPSTVVILSTTTLQNILLCVSLNRGIVSSPFQDWEFVLQVKIPTTCRTNAQCSSERKDRQFPSSQPPGYLTAYLNATNSMLLAQLPCGRPSMKQYLNICMEYVVKNIPN